MAVAAGILFLAVGAVLSFGIEADIPYIADDTVAAVLIALGLTLVVAGAVMSAAKADRSDEGGAGLLLLTLGMVLVWGLEVDVPQVDDVALGFILMVGGVVALAATVAMERQRSRTRRVVERRAAAPR